MCLRLHRTPSRRKSGASSFSALGAGTASRGHRGFVFDRRFLPFAAQPGKSEGRSTDLRKRIRPLGGEESLLEMMSCAACRVSRPTQGSGISRGSAGRLSCFARSAERCFRSCSRGGRCGAGNESVKKLAVRQPVPHRLLPTSRLISVLVGPSMSAVAHKVPIES